MGINVSINLVLFPFFFFQKRADSVYCVTCHKHVFQVGYSVSDNVIGGNFCVLTQRRGWETNSTITEVLPSRIYLAWSTLICVCVGGSIIFLQLLNLSLLGVALSHAIIKYADFSSCEAINSKRFLSLPSRSDQRLNLLVIYFVHYTLVIIEVHCI